MYLGVPPIIADTRSEKGGPHHTSVATSSHAVGHLPRGPQAHLQRSMYWQAELKQRCGVNLPQEPRQGGQCPTAGNEETPNSSSAPNSSAASGRTSQSTARQNHETQSRDRRRLAQGHTATDRARTATFLFPDPWSCSSVMSGDGDPTPKELFKEL